MKDLIKYLFRILAIVLSFALLFAAYGGRVDPTVWTLPSLATLALPAVAVVVMVSLALMALFRQWRSALVVVGALMLSWPTLRLISPLNFGHSEASSSATRLKVLTMNVKEFNWNESTAPSKSMRYILDQDADVVTIQEGTVYFTYENLATVKPMLQELYKKYPYRKQGFFDVGILSKYPFEELHPDVLKADSIGYFIKAWSVDAPGGELTVVSMHLSSLRFTGNDTRILDSMNKPSGRKSRARSVVKKLSDGFVSHARQAQAVRQLLDQTSGDVIVMGDMNDTPGSFAYRTICGDDMSDTWADAGLGPVYTFHPHHLYVKIDHILYRGQMKMLSCRRDKEGASDHYPMVAEFER